MSKKLEDKENASKTKKNLTAPDNSSSGKHEETSYQNLLFLLEVVIEDILVTHMNECAPEEYPLCVNINFQNKFFISICDKMPYECDGDIKMHGKSTLFALEKPVTKDDQLHIEVCKKRRERCKFHIGSAKVTIKSLFDKVARDCIQRNPWMNYLDDLRKTKLKPQNEETSNQDKGESEIDDESTSMERDCAEEEEGPGNAVDYKEAFQPTFDTTKKLISFYNEKCKLTGNVVLILRLTCLGTQIVSPIKPTVRDDLTCKGKFFNQKGSCKNENEFYSDPEEQNVNCDCKCNQDLRKGNEHKEKPRICCLPRDSINTNNENTCDSNAHCTDNALKSSETAAFPDSDEVWKIPSNNLRDDRCKRQKPRKHPDVVCKCKTCSDPSKSSLKMKCICRSEIPKQCFSDKNLSDANEKCCCKQKRFKCKGNQNNIKTACTACGKESQNQQYSRGCTEENNINNDNNNTNNNNNINSNNKCGQVVCCCMCPRKKRDIFCKADLSNLDCNQLISDNVLPVPYKPCSQCVKYVPTKEDDSQWQMREKLYREEANRLLKTAWASLQQAL